MWKLPLLPIAALIEIFLLAGCWLLAVFSPPRAKRVSDWATRKLPSLGWYFGK